MYKLQLLLCLTFNLNIMNPINLVIPEGNFIFRNKPNSKESGSSTFDITLVVYPLCPLPK